MHLFGYDKYIFINRVSQEIVIIPLIWINIKSIQFSTQNLIKMKRKFLYRNNIWASIRFWYFSHTPKSLL